MEHISEPNFDYIIFTNQRHNYSNFVFNKEFEAVTNKAAKLFGVDLNFKGQFNYENEKTEIDNNTWQGRYWCLGEIDIALEINESTRKFNLVLVIPKNTHIGLRT